MSRLRWHAGFSRQVPGLAIALAALGQLPGVAAADSLFPVSLPFTLDLTWSASLDPVPPAPAPADAPELLPPFHFDDEPIELFAQETPSPGLQLLFNPDDEEVFLGWQFEF
ncbi:MAG: hypothetical protein JNK40_09975 [Chromatiales bacterium]|nr:hypothetical protein [Chromatiales bacterium]